MLCTVLEDLFKDTCGGPAISTVARIAQTRQILFTFRTRRVKCSCLPGSVQDDHSTTALRIDFEVILKSRKGTLDKMSEQIW